MNTFKRLSFSLHVQFVNRIIHSIYLIHLLGNIKTKRHHFVFFLVALFTTVATCFLAALSIACINLFRMPTTGIIRMRSSSLNVNSSWPLTGCKCCDNPTLQYHCATSSTVHSSGPLMKVQVKNTFFVHVIMCCGQSTSECVKEIANTGVRLSDVHVQVGAACEHVFLCVHW